MLTTRKKTFPVVNALEGGKNEYSVTVIIKFKRKLNSGTVNKNISAYGSSIYQIKKVKIYNIIIIN